MATFEITAPDGRKFRITGETPEGAHAALMKHIGASTSSARGEGVDTQGFADPLLEALKKDIPTPGGPSPKPGQVAAVGPLPPFLAPDRLDLPVQPTAPQPDHEAGPVIDQNRPASPPVRPREGDRLEFGMMGGASPDTEAWARREIARQMAEQGAASDPLLAAMMSSGPTQRPRIGDRAAPPKRHRFEDERTQLSSDLEETRRQMKAATGDTLAALAAREEEIVNRLGVLDERIGRMTTDPNDRRRLEIEETLMSGATPDGSRPLTSADRANLTGELEALMGAEPSPRDAFAGEGTGDLLKRRGQQFARGASEMIASGYEGVGALSQRAMRSPGSQEAAGAMLAERAQTIADIEARLASPDLDAETRAFLTQNLADLRKGQEELALTAAGKARMNPEFGAKASHIRDKFTETFGAPPDDPSFWAKLSEGAGSMAGFLASTGLGALAGGPAGGVVATISLGSTSNAGQVYTEAKQAGATDEDALSAAGWGAIVGSTEAIPIGRAFKILPSSVREKLTGTFFKRAGEIALNAGEEAVQEWSAQVMNNLIAQGYYDPERGWAEGASESALIGAILGAGTGALAVAVDSSMEAPAVTPPESEDNKAGPRQPAPPPADPLVAAMGGEVPPNVPPKPAQKMHDNMHSDVTSSKDATNPVEKIKPPDEGGDTDVPEGTSGYEILDEIETVNGETRATGRKVRVDLDTGQATVIDAEEAADGESSAGAPDRARAVPEDQPQAAPVSGVGTAARPAAGSAPNDRRSTVNRPSKAAPSAPQKRPFTNMVKRRGIRIDPNGPVGQELIAAGVTPQSTPGLFMKGGLTDLDNLVASEHQDIADLIGIADDETYLDQRRFIDALTSEAGGRPLQNAEEAEKQANFNAWNEAIARARRGYDADQGLPDLTPLNPAYTMPPVDQDISTGPERRKTAEWMVNTAAREFGLDTTLTPQERLAIIDEIDRNGGDVEVAIVATIERSIHNAEHEAIEHERGIEPPFEPVGTGQESDGGSRQQPGSEAGSSQGPQDDQGRRGEAEREEGVAPPADDLLAAMGAAPTPKPQERPQDAAPPPAGGDDLLSMMGAAPAKNPAKDARAKDEARVRGNQSKIRTGTPQGDAGPLFDTQMDIEAAASRKSTPEEMSARLSKIREKYDLESGDKFQNVQQTEAGRDLVDRLAAVSGFEARSKVATDWVREKGKKNGREHLVALDKDGNPLLIGRGEKSAINFPRGIADMARTEGAVLLTHNHPSSRGISTADIAAMVSSLNGAQVIATGHNGNVLEMKPGAAIKDMVSRGLDRLSPEIAEFVKILNIASRDMRAPLQKTIIAVHQDDAAGMAREAAKTDFLNAYWDIMYNQALHQIGVVELSGDGLERARKAKAENEHLAIYDIDEIIDEFADTFLHHARIGRAGLDIAEIERRHRDRGAEKSAADTRDESGDRAAGTAPEGRDGDGRVRGSDQVAKDDFDSALDDVFGAQPDAPSRKEITAEAKKADRNPSDAQKEAGNYKMGHIAWNGLDITIETAKGAMRRGTDRDGEAWSVKMPADYGYIKRTEGADGDHVDIYMGDHPDSDYVLVVDQVDPETGKFDEHKVILGTRARAEAQALYVAGFSDKKGAARIGGVKEMTVAEFKDWLADGDQSKRAGTTKAETRPSSDIAKDLGDLFNEPGAGFREGEIDADKYAKAVPLFTEALSGVDMENTPRKDVFVAMIRPLAAAGLSRDAVAKMRPYFDRFLRELDDGIIAIDQEASNAPGTGGDLERDSGDTDPQDRVGGTDVPASGGGDGNRAGTRGAAPDGRGELGPGGERLSPDSAAPVGAGRDQGLQGDGRTGQQPADGRDGAAGRDAGQSGIPADDSPAEATGDLARNSPAVKDRIAAQKAADERAKRGVKLGDEQNIRDTLPLLLPEQQDDVVKVERRFLKPDGHGMMLTNGTGTGKTYSGGGVIKRFAQAGKENILVLAPSQGILDHWIEALHDLGLKASKLESSTEAGKGIVVTTYANAGINTALAGREWDLVVSDEAHKLSQNAAGDTTEALRSIRAITNRPADLWHKSQMIRAQEWDKLRSMPDGEAKTALAHRLYDQQKADIAQFAKKPRSKVLFLSATPFAYDKNVDYGEGYLFSYGEDGHVGNSRQDGRSLFFVQNFGYRIRYHKLTRPDANVDSGVFEREFHEKLRREGMLSGRHLDIEPDYERRFVQREDAQGSQIDGILDFIREQAFGKGPDKDDYYGLYQSIGKNFNYLKRMQLLEAIKARLAKADIDKHLALGRKVVIFHDYNVGGGFNPFRGNDFAAQAGYLKLVKARPEVEDLNFTGYLPPVQELKNSYGDRAVIYNGTVPTKDRAKAKKDFNTDGSGVDLMIVQSAAGEAGISLHDITGTHQRALINLGMPTRPTTALQEEGRIRREGSVSDALFHYYTIGTTWERQAFARKIAERSGTVENLALGNEARTIRDSFIQAYEDASPWEPGDTDGKGGKERDRAVAKASPYDIAKTHYFGRMKSRGRRDQREGIDFYPTPEPLAFKMVEWAGIRPYERVLEPSAGDGAIARYFPEHSDRTIVEPSADLRSRAELRAVGSRAVGSTFENYHVVNKHHVIVMNPPFGSGGKTAMEHLAKAMTHLRPGGRIVALIPTGPAADKRFDNLFETEVAKDFDLAANIYLPAVTFEKASTSVMSRVVVIDRLDKGQEINAVGYRQHSFVDAQKIATLFDRLEDFSVRDRQAPAKDAADEILDEQEAENPAAATPERPSPPLHDQDFTLGETTHGKTGEKLFVATATARVDNDAWKATVAVAKRHGGWFSSFRGRGAIPGYQFKSEEARQAFLDDVRKPTVGLEQPAYHGSPHIFDRFSLDKIGTGEGAQAFGWGLYFAGRKGVAEYYRRTLTAQDGADRVMRYADGTDVDILDWPRGISDLWFDADNTISHEELVARAKAAREDAKSRIKNQTLRDAQVARHQETIDFLTANPGVHLGTRREGRLYKVDIPEDSDLLAWDEQVGSSATNADRKLENALVRQMNTLRDRDQMTPAWENLWDKYEDGGVTTAEFYRNLGQTLVPKGNFSDQDRAASEWLRAAGIPGHRFLDQGSRVQGQGSYNYVIYDDAAVAIEGFEQPPGIFVDGRMLDEEPDWLADPEPLSREEIRALMPKLRAELDRLDLKRVKLWQDNTGVEWQGMFLRSPERGMEIIIGASLDPMKTIHHEVVHILRGMNLFTPQEWRALELMAARKWIDEFDIVARYPNLQPSEQIEEAIAEAFAEAASTKKSPAQSIIAQAFNKILRLMRAIRNVFNGAGFNTVEDVFGRIIAGELTRRNAGNTGAFAAMQEEKRQAARVPSRQARAHMSTAMGGSAAYVPDRRVWEELSRAGAPIWERLREGVGAAHDMVDRARIVMQDRFLPVMRAQQAVTKSFGITIPESHNAYLTETTFSGKVGRHLFEIDEEYTKPIISLIAGSKALTADTVGLWLAARHAVERNAYIATINPAMPDGGSGMTDAEAQQVLADAAAGPDAARLDQIGDLIDKLRERSLKLREDAGLITHQEAQLWRTQYQFYVPLKGFSETDHSEAVLDLTGTGRRYNVRGGETKRALGRRSEAFNPLQSAITQAQEVAIRAEKNRVGQAVLKLARDFKSPALWSVKKVQMKRFFNRTTGLVETRPEDPVSLFMDPNEMAVKENGQEHRILFHDPRLADALGSVGSDQLGWFVRIMSMAGRWFSMTRTMLNPEFVITNAFRDMQAGQINMQAFGGKDAGAIGRAMLKNWPKAFAGVYRGLGNKADSEWTRYFKEFDEAGAKVSFWTLENPEAGLKDLDKRIWLASGPRARRIMKTMVSPSAFFSTRDNGVLHFVERTNMAVDNAIRLAAYVEARKHGWSKSEAAALSKNMTVNFNRRGSGSTTMNALYVFFNAAVQGSVITLKAIRDSRKVQFIVLGLIAAGLVNDLANAYLSEEDDDDVLAYDKIPDFQSQRAIQFMAGRDSGEAVSIPMPYGYNVFPYLGQQIGKVVRGVKSPDEAFLDTAASIFGAFSPVSGGDFASFITPTVGDPVLEIARNADWLNRPIAPDYPNDMRPDSQKFYGGATEISKAAAEVANRMTGGTTGSSGWMDVSPEYLDHVFSFVVGSAGAFVGRSVDLVAKAANGNLDDATINDIPFMRVVVKDTYDGLDRDRYYRFRERVEKASHAVKTSKTTGEALPDEVRLWATLGPALKEAEKRRRKGEDIYLKFNRKVTEVIGVIAE